LFKFLVGSIDSRTGNKSESVINSGYKDGEDVEFFFANDGAVLNRVLTDRNMRDMSGPGLIRNIKAKYSPQVVNIMLFTTNAKQLVREEEPGIFDDGNVGYSKKDLLKVGEFIKKSFEKIVGTEVAKEIIEEVIINVVSEDYTTPKKTGKTQSTPDKTDIGISQDSAESEESTKKVGTNNPEAKQVVSKCCVIS